MSSHRFEPRCLRGVPIERVLAARGIHLTPRGPRLIGSCPIHGGDNPRAFVVHRARNLWYCFTHCAAGGNVIDLVCRLDRTGYRAAAACLAALGANSPTPLRPASTEPPPPPSFRPYARTLRLDPHVPFLHRKGIRPETARRFDVGLHRGHPRAFLHGCIGVRLHGPRGRPLGYAGRRLDPEQARALGKWKLPPRFPKSRTLYNFHRVRESLQRDGVILVEGPWAVLRLAQLRLPALALLGISLSAAQAVLLEPARQIVLMLDGDPAGKLATDRLRDRLDRSQPLRLPDGCDPDDLLDADLRALLRPFFSS